MRAFRLACARISTFPTAKIVDLLLFSFIQVRELPDMRSALEGEGGHGKADIVREVA